MKQSNSFPSRMGLEKKLSEWKNKKAVLLSKQIDDQNVFSIRSFNISTDLDIIHKWANMDYSKRFWQMDGSVEMLSKAFEEVKANTHVGSFIGCLNGTIVCQLDAYDPGFDNLSNYYEHKLGDIGIHLLLGPDKTTIPNFSAKVVMAFASWLFSSGQIIRIITEPDKDNRASNWLLRRLKFTFLGELSMPEKSANLFGMTKQVFETCPNDFL